MPSITYDAWYDSPRGGFALDAQQFLLRRMIAGWPRRGHNLLELFCASGRFLESFWEAGFEVTGQEQNQELASFARKRLGPRVDISLHNPEQLPFEDQGFDYVVCLNGLEFAENPTAVLREAGRLAGRGLLLGFPSAWSLRGIFARLVPGRRKPSQEFGLYRDLSPLRVWKLLRRLEIPGRFSWGSILLGPASTWSPGRIRGAANRLRLPAPLGACVMLRLDFPPTYAGTPLLLEAAAKKDRQAKAVMARASRL